MCGIFPYQSGLHIMFDIADSSRIPEQIKIIALVMRKPSFIFLNHGHVNSAGHRLFNIRWPQHD